MKYFTNNMSASQQVKGVHVTKKMVCFRFYIWTIPKYKLAGPFSQSGVLQEVFLPWTFTLDPAISMEKSCPGQKGQLPTLCEPTFTHLPTKHGKPLTREKKRLSQLGHPFLMVALPFQLGQLNIYILNTLPRVVGSTLSRRDNQSMHKHCWLRQGGQLFWPYKHLLKLTQLGG